MPLFRRSAPVHAEVVTDLAQDDAELADVRDRVVAGGPWQPAADLLAATPEPDRRGAVVNVLAAAAVRPAPWLDAWLRARPDDPGAHVVAAWATVQRAWDARGSAYARETGEDAFAAFFRILADALPVCHHAARTGGDDPTPWVVEMWLSIGRGDARDVLDDRWAEVIDRDPHNRLGHIARLQTLSDKWYGSHDQMYDFARSVNGPAWAPVVPLQAHAEYEMRERTEGRAKDLAGFWHRPDVAADLDRGYAWAVAGGHRHHDTLHDLTVVGYTLSLAERWGQASDVFALTSDRAFEYPWYYQPDPDAAFSKALTKATRSRKR